MDFNRKITSGDYTYYDLDGMQHRLSGPAIESQTNKHFEWMVFNKYHRLNGPAIISTDGEQWFHSGKRHRVGGPAITYFGSPRKEYFVNGKRHRLDGYAVEYGGSSGVYYFNGIEVIVGSFAAYKEYLLARGVVI